LNKKPKKIIISGGGTGGHVFPAIAIADALKEKDPTIQIQFVGAEGKMEMEKVPAAGYPIEGLWISGIQRKLSLQNFLFPFKLISSMWKARNIIKRFKPDVAVGVGGYASYPTLAMAAKRGIPTLIQEQNSYAGVSNKMLKNKVRTVCVAYDNMEQFFPGANIIWTGNPVRKDIVDLSGKREEALQHFGFKADRKTIVILGGSLGARTLNNSMGGNTELLAKHPEVQVLWQAGSMYIEEFKASATAQLENVNVQAFIKRMDLAYAAADVVIGRAGALTISELCLVGKPAILVPSPNVAEDHQTKNAMALVEKEAAILVRDAAAETMLPIAIELLENANRSAVLAQNIKQLAKPDAAARIATEVLKLIDSQP
jgi:UDP-N-acetylglucosamine--N-acetylmuramyl-(pentapeptide) pyrophosphoryl-undecaprenol N-acetylglucosamine transferase